MSYVLVAMARGRTDGPGRCRRSGEPRPAATAGGRGGGLRGHGGSAERVGWRRCCHTTRQVGRCACAASGGCGCARPSAVPGRRGHAQLYRCERVWASAPCRARWPRLTGACVMSRAAARVPSLAFLTFAVRYMPHLANASLKFARGLLDMDASHVQTLKPFLKVRGLSLKRTHRDPSSNLRRAHACVRRGRGAGPTARHRFCRCCRRKMCPTRTWPHCLATP